ncbi:MAG: Gfo/Idh/MocA family oxidoreductase [Verrucomicrobiales bacterium]|nr:Gfo/Idh/MocA family oxidoreductase [Verrucomicrobiales bacterium]
MSQQDTPMTPPTQSTNSRRQVLKYGAGFGIALAWPGSRVLGANEDVRVGVVGINGRGGSHIDAFSKMKGVRLAALCDVDPRVLDGKITNLSKKTDYKTTGFSDMRKMLDSNEVDVLSTATPNHWHTLAGVWALQAGKDAYVEKPISHNVWEGRQLAKLARKLDRICQGGTQSRSVGSLRAAVKFIQDGGLGKIKYAKGMCYKPRQSIGKGGGAAIPDGLDYDLWCGPKPVENPIRRKKFHYDWHWFYAYGNGDMGNQGIHQMDVARWFLGEDKIAPRTLSIGGRLGYDDDGETPNTQIVYHDYEAAPLIFETRGLPKDKAAQESGWGAGMNRPDEFPDGSGISVVIVCEGGNLFADAGGKVMVTDKEGKKMDAPKAIESDDIFTNFIKAVRSRKREDQYAESEETHLSSALCHTGLISHQLGQTMSQGEILERIKGDDLLADRYASMADHLGQNGVNLDQNKLTLGAWLKFNGDTEWFEGNGDLDGPANKLARPEYRDPYVVPEVA